MRFQVDMKMLEPLEIEFRGLVVVSRLRAGRFKKISTRKLIRICVPRFPTIVPHDGLLRRINIIHCRENKKEQKNNTDVGHVK